MSLALSVTQAARSCSEHELVAAVRRGSDRAFEELYSRYRSRIGSYIFGMVGDHQRAEDIAQEVFIAALRRLRATERPIAFKSWIYEIAKNACIDEFRRTQRAREVPLDGEEPDAAPQPLIAHGADAAVENKQRLDDLWGAFRGLSDSHHRIIVMRELEGRSYSQIGESLGMSKPVVESTLFRARRRLSNEYDELASGRRCERVQGVIAAEGERPLRSLGLRDRKLLARHLSHCQPCRRMARMAGVDESFFHTPSLAAKIAALFPLPWVRWRRGHGNGNGGGSGEQAAAGGGAHSVTALQSLQSVAPMVDPTGPAAGLGRAAATAAAIVVAGAGGGIVTGLPYGDRMPVAQVMHTVRGGSSGSASAPGSTHGAVHATANGGLGWLAVPGQAGGAGTNPSFARGSGTGAGARTAKTLPSGARGAARVPASGVASSSQSTTTGPTSNGKQLPLVGGGGSSRAPGAVTSALPAPKLPTTSLPKLPKLPSLPKLPVSVPTLPSNPLPKPQLPSITPPKLPPLSVPDPRSLLPPLGGQGKTH